MEGHFRIVTTVRNAEHWIAKCIKSVLDQTDDRWTQIIVVDGAEDDTYNQALIAADDDPRIVIHREEQHRGICQSHITAHDHSVRGEGDVFIHLDGDDWLYPNCLAVLREVYTAYPHIWSTYGNYTTESGHPSIVRSVKPGQSGRQQIHFGWPYSHPRTFRAPLWDKLDKDDLKDGTGRQFSSAVDVAIMCPILEMCGNRVAMLYAPLYHYNDNTGLNESTLALDDQVRCALEVARKPPYKPL